MVRYVSKARESQLERRRSRYGVTGYKRWVDPYPWVHGTEPEKRVYQALSLRGIRFYFLNEYNFNIPEIDFFKEYQVDFILPDQKIIIEVQGYFWHTKPGTIESDAFKFAVYEALGWRPLAWWDYEIIDNVNALCIRDGLGGITTNTASSELPPLSRKKQDTSKGIRTLNTKRGQRLAYRKPAVRFGKKKRKSFGSYNIGVK